jgi:hypothetical protein
MELKQYSVNELEKMPIRDLITLQNHLTELIVNWSFGNGNHESIENARELLGQVKKVADIHSYNIFDKLDAINFEHDTDPYLETPNGHVDYKKMYKWHFENNLKFLRVHNVPNIVVTKRIRIATWYEAMITHHAFLMSDLWQLRLWIETMIKRAATINEKGYYDWVKFVTPVGYASKHSRHLNALITTFVFTHDPKTVQIIINRYEPWGNGGNGYITQTFNQILQKLNVSEMEASKRLTHILGYKYVNTVLTVQDLSVACTGPQTKYKCEKILNAKKVWNRSFGFCSGWSLFYMYMRLIPENLHISDDDLAIAISLHDNAKFVCIYFADFIDHLITISKSPHLFPSKDHPPVTGKLLNKKRFVLNKSRSKMITRSRSKLESKKSKSKTKRRMRTRSQSKRASKRRRLE